MKQTETLGVWVMSDNTVVELLDVEYGIEDVAVIRDPDGTVSRATIHYDAGIEDENCAHIKIGETKLYFDECVLSS